MRILGLTTFKTSHKYTDMEKLPQILAMAILLLYFTPASAQVAGCPMDTPTHREMIEEFLTSNEYAHARNTYSIPSNAINSLRHLGSRHIIIGEQGSMTDTAACGILNDYYSNHIQSPQNPDPFHQPVYYTAGGFYFVVLRLRPAPGPNQLLLGLEYVVIYDSTMTRLMGYTI